MTALDGWRVLVLAKAPVPGRVKTRLGATVGMDVAAEVAAAALLDTLAAAEEAVGRARCLLALEGDLASACASAELLEAVAGWRTFPQRGDELGERLAAAHADAGPGAVVQVGMDTPQVSAADLADLAARLEAASAVLAPAEDGGWWALGLRDPLAAAALVGVPMSTSTTYDDTRRALEATGLVVGTAPTACDVDTVIEAEALAARWPDLRFSRRWRELVG